MATLYSPKIVTDGLVMYLDAANPRSYPRSGTTWSDISFNNNSGSLTNGATFNSGDGGSISFDGINDYVLLPTNFFNHDAQTPFSVSMWFKTSTAGAVLLGQQSAITPNSAPGGWVPAIYIQSNGTLTTSCFWGGSDGNASTTTQIVTNNVWYNVTVTFASTSHTSYLNGVSFGTITKTQTTYASTYYYFLGSGRYTNWAGADASPYFTGNISNFMFYTRQLSAVEILQNFNATRNRFGV